MAEVKWIRLTLSMFDDEKIKIIESMPDGDTILIIWVKLLILAGKVNDTGYIYLSDAIPYTDEMLATIFRRPLTTVRLALQTFEKFGMIETASKGILIVNWEKHQNIDGMERIKELTRNRVQKHRQKQLTDGVTQPGNVTVTLPVTLRNATDIDIDIKNKNKNKNIKENTQKKKEFRVENFPVPEWINPDLWTSFMEVREKKKAVQSEQALKLILSDLTRYHEEGQDVDLILRRSIKSSWKDVYSLKDKPTGSAHPKSKPQPQRVTARTEEYPMEAYYEGLK